MSKKVHQKFAPHILANDLEIDKIDIRDSSGAARLFLAEHIFCLHRAYPFWYFGSD